MCSWVIQFFISILQSVSVFVYLSIYVCGSSRLRWSCAVDGMWKSKNRLQSAFVPNTPCSVSFCPVSFCPVNLHPTPNQASLRALNLHKKLIHSDQFFQPIHGRLQNTAMSTIILTKSVSQECDVMPWANLFRAPYPASTQIHFQIQSTIRSVATGNQWSGPMKLH